MHTPKLDNFFSVGEFEKHFGTIIMFPERKDIWRNNASVAQKLIIQLANIIIKYEKVFFCIKPELLENIKGKLDEKIEIVQIDYDDIWARDISPNFVVRDGEIRAVCWQFNSWGGINEGAYFPWDKDAEFGKKISGFFKMNKYVVDDVVLEGGAVITDGEGTLLTTKSVLLNRNRNPNLSQGEMEKRLHEYFNVEKIIWFDEGLFLDETDGHIDNLCNFVKPGEVCLAWTEDRDDPQYNVVKKAYEILINSKDAKGRKFKINKIIMPEKQFILKEEAEGIEISMNSTQRTEGFQLLPSYINYYFINSALLLPAFGCKEDIIAYNKMKEIFPNREVIQLNSKEILIGGGGFHCILHEIPERTNNDKVVCV